MALNYLQVENLTKSFGDNLLFENISFGIFEGQRVALIAKNGSGKTTLLNIIAGKSNTTMATSPFEETFGWAFCLRILNIRQD